MKKTRKALFLSVCSMILCVAMFLGTTAAWFTDSVTSGVNKIEAGNLDIEVSSKVGTEWVSIQDSSSLFSSNLWEPGHTEYVTLKVENKGSLAFKYRMNVTPISETGGINVEGNAFKLSDYLVWKTTVPSETDSTPADRAAARTVAGTELKLNQAGLSQNGTMLSGGAAQYITLVVYMPETVGNEANYKTGTTAPNIELGIKFLATQLSNESDSFGDDYDADVDYDAAAAALEYNYFPQVNVTGQLVIDNTSVNKGPDAGAETTVTQINETISKVVLASPDKVEENTAAKLTTIVNKGTLADKQKGSMTLKVVKDDVANAYFQTTQTSVIDTTKQDSTTYQISVQSEGVVAVPESTGKALYKVDLFIGKGRTNVKMYHNTVAMTEDTNATPVEKPETFVYNTTTGYATLYVDTFSPFIAIYDLPVAAIGTTVYYSIQAAVDAITDGTQTTIKLCGNASGNGVDVPAGRNIIFDFCGYTYTLQGEMVGSNTTKTNGFRFLKGATASTITMKNGKLANGATTAEGNTPAKVMVNSYVPLTLKDFSIDATTAAVAPSGSAYGTGCIYIANGPAVVTGTGTYTGDPDGKVIYMSNVEYYTDGADLTFDEQFTGTVKGNVTDGNKQAASIIIKAGNYDFGDIAFTNGTMKISGGTFTADPTEYVIDGYKAKANGTTPETWTVKAKDVPKPDANGVFTANNNEQFLDIVEELNDPNTQYTSGDYTIKLSAGTFGGTDVTGGWKADVYLIKQYPQWNEKFWTGANGSNLAAPPANHRKITLVGNDSPTERTVFRGIFVVTGFGNSNDGIPQIDYTEIKTEFKNIDFDFTNCKGVNSSYQSLYENDEGAFCPIIACGASSNVIIDKCNFTKVDRIKIGCAKNPGDDRDMIVNGEIKVLADHTADPVVKDCTFTNCDTCIDGYFENSGKAKFINIKCIGCEAFVNSQGSCKDAVEIAGCDAECINYFIRTREGSKFYVKDCEINVTTTNDQNKYGLVTFRGKNNIITFEDCSFTTSKEIRSSGSCDITSVVIMKGTSPTASQMHKTGSADCTIQDYSEN